MLWMLCNMYFVMEYNLFALNNPNFISNQILLVACECMLVIWGDNGRI